MRVVAFIPIKLNNERTPGKNTKPFADGTTLIHCIQKALLKSDLIDKVYIYCSTLDFYLETKPSACERAEGIELLRLLKNYKKVMTYTVDSKSMAVDTPKDLERVSEYLAKG